jgi:outer membrane receptor for ferrienterochelin and colicins
MLMMGSLLKRLLFTVLTLLPVWLSAQEASLSGHVLDQDSNVIQGAVVFVKGTTLGTITDRSGAFSLNRMKPGNNIFRVSFIGYETCEKEITLVPGANPVDFVLKEAVIDMNEVVVTGTKSERTLKDAPVITQVIQAEDMLKKGMVTLTDVLENEVPGLDISRFGTKTSLNMQGLGASYVLFLVDGERIAGETDGDIDYSRLNLNDIERIEIIKGASSSLYGSNAIGGVVNIITRKCTRPAEVKLYSQISKNNEWFNSATIGLKKGIFGSRSGFSYNRTDGYDLTPESPHDWTQNPYASFNYNQKFEIKPGARLLMEPYFGLYRFERGNKSARPAHDLYKDFNLGFRSHYITGIHALDLSYYRDKYSNFDVLEQLDNKQDLTSYDIIQTARLQDEFAFSEKNTFTAGAEVNYEKLFSDRIAGDLKDAGEAVLYAQEDLRMGNRWNVVAGIRASRHSQYGVHAAPKISLMYRKGAFNVRSSAGLGFRSPTLKELYMDFDHFGEWRIIGNPNLKPESSTYLSGSVEFMKSWGNASVTGYYNTIRNMINGDYWLPDTTEEKVRQYQNVSKAHIYGIEFTAKQQIFKGLKVSMGYNYTYARDEETGLPLYGSVKNSGSLGAEYHIKRKEYSASLQVFCKLTGEKYYDTETPADKPYANWRITVSQQYKWVRIHTGIDNVFNVIRPGSYNFISPGRKFFAGFTLEF